MTNRKKCVIIESPRAISSLYKKGKYNMYEVIWRRKWSNGKCSVYVENHNIDDLKKFLEYISKNEGYELIRVKSLKQ